MELKINFPNYRQLKIVLNQKKNLLTKLGKTSSDYKKELRNYFKLLIFVKAHSLSLDTREERKRLLNLLWKEFKDLEFC